MANRHTVPNKKSYKKVVKKKKFAKGGEIPPGGPLKEQSPYLVPEYEIGRAHV